MKMRADAERIIWQPQPKQALFLRRPEYEVLFGGAAGGGKSDALLAEALRQVEIPHYRGIIFRKTIPQLSELIDRSTELYRSSYPGCRYNDNKHSWRFPSGAKITFGHMQHTKDRLNYQGKRYDFIGFDELTHFLWEEYAYMFSRNRPNGPGTRCYIRSTSNPGGRGHGWVKERFIIPVAPGQVAWEAVRIRYPDGHTEIRWRSRTFIPSSVFDNQALLNNDPNYVASLALLPEGERQALLEGSWDSFSGQVFTEWRNDLDHHADRLGSHVIEPFLVPQEWRIYRGFDWGYNRPFAVGWYAVDHDQRLYRIKELYGCTRTPNEGVKWEPGKVAAEIRIIEAQDPNLRGRRIRGLADPSIFNKSSAGGESVANLMAQEGVYWERGDNDRLNGKMQLHHRLAFDDQGIPMLYVFSSCRGFIRTIPTLVYDEVRVEDVDTDQEDHIYDECRYVLMDNPISPRPHAAPRIEPYDPTDPLSTPPTQYRRYNFFRRY